MNAPETPAAAIAPTVQDARRAKLDALAGTLATLGATLGIVAGAIDLAVGSSIRDWVGNKLDTTRLGAATLILSAVALAAALAWRRSSARTGGRRLATLLALLLPAGICFTTIGRLWYIPGALLLIAAALIGAASTRADLARAIDERRWRAGLTVTLGAYYVFLGADALGIAGVLGILGGLAMWAALIIAPRNHRLALALLALGALPFAVATWWSVVTPLIAILALVTGRAAVRPRTLPQQP